MASCSANLETHKQRTIYLITLSRSERQTLSKEEFAGCVVDAWAECTQSRVAHYVVCEENHADGGKHFHMAIKLTKKARWVRVRRHLQDEFQIKVNFSDNHTTYFSAYHYVTKEDVHYKLSEGHPDFSDVQSEPKTSQGTRKRKQNAVAKPSKKKRLRVYDVVEIIQTRGIKARLELMALAHEWQQQGKTDLAEFVANRGPRVVNEAILTAQELSEATQKLIRSKKSRMELLTEAEKQPCVGDCNGSWLKAAKEILESNGIDRKDYCTAIITAISCGRGKYRNIFIHGPANCGKSFLLAPLKAIYKCFVNPASGSFAWVGAEKAEVIYLNDFRWSSALIAWNEFLQLLEGDVMHLSAPKNFVQQDIVFDKDTPFFATADTEPVLVKGGHVDAVNTEMMRVRWRFFNLWHQIRQEDQKEMKPCPHCFSHFILCKDI